MIISSFRSLSRRSINSINQNPDLFNLVSYNTFSNYVIVTGILYQITSIKDKLSYLKSKLKLTFKNFNQFPKN